MKVYIIVYRTEQQDEVVGEAYLSLEEAKAEVERIDAATPWGSAGVVIRDLNRPREWTEEQRRWMRGAS